MANPKDSSKADAPKKPEKKVNIEENLSELARRRGFFYPSSEIYGGLAGLYDYGSIGTLIKRNIENQWRKHFLGLNDNFFEIEAANIMAEKTFVASGHLANFTDPSVRCKKCGVYSRADHLVTTALKQNVEGATAEQLTKMIIDNKIKCPKCGGDLAEVKVLNMMLPLKLGAEGDTISYLRPETAQGVYVNFLRQFNIQRGKLPLGLGIIGKAFRNEISPRQSITRQREFTQAELQIFFDPEEINNAERFDEVSKYEMSILFSGKADSEKFTCADLVSKKEMPKFYVYYMAKMHQFYTKVIGLPDEKVRMRELSKEERAFYNKIHFDIEMWLDSLKEFKEVGGVHYRTDHDLGGHGKISGKSHEIFYLGKRFVPHVLELSAGIDRILYAAMDTFYRPAVDREWEWFAFPNAIAPFKFAVFPLMGKDKIPEEAEKVYNLLKSKYSATYDDGGSIGRRYARADEIGIPYAITIDYDTLKDGTVTVRDRNTMLQVRKKPEEIEG